VASLQARSPLRSAHPLFFINKVLSFAAFAVLLGIGWVALSYLKSDVIDRWRSAPPQNTTVSKAAGVPAKDVNSPEVGLATAPVRLVYSCASDGELYHGSTHLRGRCERTALSEEAAIQRGLKRCKVCFPD
jgi:hypothetical protein